MNVGCDDRSLLIDPHGATRTSADVKKHRPALENTALSGGGGAGVRNNGFGKAAGGDVFGELLDLRADFSTQLFMKEGALKFNNTGTINIHERIRAADGN